MTSTKAPPSRKIGGWAKVFAVIAAILAAVLVLVMIFVTWPQWGPGAEASDVCATTENVHYFALDEGKEVQYAFGVKIVQTEQEKILGELHDRRCDDPALTATHMYEWGLISFNEIYPTMVKFETDTASWRAAIKQMEKLEAESTVSITSVAKGLPSLYMVPDDKGRVTVHQGFTSSAGSALTFVNGDTTVMLRLECGFQPVRPPGFPPEVPPCPPGAPECPAPKNPSLDVGVNPAVDDWKKDDGPTHTVNNNDGATDSQGIQTDPQADANKAAEEAAAKAKADADAAEAARKAAEESGGGTVDDNQDHGETTGGPNW